MSRIRVIYLFISVSLELITAWLKLLVDPEHSMTTKLYSAGYHRNCSLLSHSA